jgi:hypothetical protein
LLGFGFTVDDIAETTEEIGNGILERRLFSWEGSLIPFTAGLETTAVLAVVDVVVDKVLVLVVGGCFEALGTVVAAVVVVALSPKEASALESDSLPMLQRLFRLFGSGGSPCVIPPELAILLISYTFYIFLKEK